MNSVTLKNKFEKSLQRLFWTATLTGLIPFKADRTCFRILTSVYFTVNSLALLAVSCQLCRDLLDDSAKDVNKIIEIILNIGVFFSGFVLMIMYKFNVESMKGLLVLARENFRFHSQYFKEDPCSIEPTLDLINIGVPVLMICTYASSYQWLVVPIFFSGTNGRRLLPVDTTYPYRTNDSPLYELTYMLQAYLLTILAFTFSHVNASFTTLTTLLASQYDILCCNIRHSADVDRRPGDIVIPTFLNLSDTPGQTTGNCKDVQDRRVKKKRLEETERNTLRAIAGCVELHLVLRKFCRELQNYFNLPFTFQLLMVVVTMGCAVISFLQRFAMNTLQFTMISLAFLVVLCFQGQQILHKSGNIHEAVCQSGWRRRGACARRAYILLMQQGLFPDRIVVGYGLFQLNLANLIAILKASFSFFTLLNQIIGPKK